LYKVGVDETYEHYLFEKVAIQAEEKPVPWTSIIAPIWEISLGVTPSTSRLYINSAEEEAFPLFDIERFIGYVPAGPYIIENCIEVSVTVVGVMESIMLRVILLESVVKPVPVIVIVSPAFPEDGVMLVTVGVSLVE